MKSSLACSSRSSFVTFLAIVAVCCATIARGQSALDAFDPNASGNINALATQADGKVLVTGIFSSVGGQTRYYLARLNVDGSVDTAFNPNPNSYVYPVAVQADGKVLVGGSFSTIAGVSRSHIARLNADGSADLAFNPGANGDVVAIVLQPDGKILVGGAFTSIGGQTRNRIARLNADGSLDSTFVDANANDVVRAIVVQPNGKILVGGDFTSVGGTARNAIARLNTDGSLDTSYNPDAPAYVNAIVLQVDEKAVIGGGFQTVGGQPIPYIARLNSDGSVDTNFNPSPNNDVDALALQPDGKIVVGGQFTSIGGQPRTSIARLNQDGSLDSGFAPEATKATLPRGVFAIAVQPDAKIVFGGYFEAVGGQPRNNIARVYSDGSLDTTADPNANGNAPTIALQPDGKILIGGGFTALQPNGAVGATARNRIARLNPDGTVDANFDPNADDFIQTIAVQSDGKILVGGQFTTIGGQAIPYLARLNANGTADTSFQPNVNFYLTVIALQSDGKILIGGAFNVVGGQARNSMARLNSDGSLDTSFNPNADGSVQAIAVQPDGKIVIGGFFTHVGGQARNYVARLNSNGTLDTAFNPNASNGIEAIALQPDGKILTSGFFTSIGGQTRNYIARLNADGALDSSFDPNANNDIGTIVLQTDGTILVGGTFTALQPNGAANPTTRNRIARLNADGTLDPAFDPNADNYVGGIAVESDGKILVGGLFSTIGGQTRNRIARLTNTSAALQDLSVTRTTITWTRSGAEPELSHVTFELSTDGTTYTFLGNGTRIGTTSNFTLTGQSLPTQQNIYIRARGFYRGARYTGSNSITESVRNAFLLAAPTLTTTATNAAVQSGISDTATLAGGKNATGTITFSLYGPNNATCAGTPIFTSTKTVNGNGPYQSGSYTATQVGTYRWVASYSGDGHNESVATACNDANEASTVSKAVPTITTKASAAAPIGSSFTDSVTVSGGYNVTGTVTFALYNYTNTTCSIAPDFTSTKTLSSDGKATSDPITPFEVGTYRWVVTYNGDANNASVSSACNDPNELAVVTKSNATITTQASSSVLVGGTISDTARVFGNSYNSTGGTVTFNLYGPDDASCGGGAIFSSTKDVTASGEVISSDAYTATAAGTYRWVASYSGDHSNNAATSPCNAANESVLVTQSTPTPTPTPAATATPAPPTRAQPLNISTRMEVLTNDNVLIAGFIVTGEPNATKKVMIRGLGPSLAKAGVPNPLSDPLLELHGPAGFSTVVNDNWADASNTTDIPSGFQPADSRESVIIATLSIGSQGFANYTAILRGANGETGVGLVEAYDLEAGTNQFANISTRGFIDTGDNVMIGGFILGGSDQSSRVLIRAIGPSLPVSGALADPTLEIHDGQGAKVASNDNWKIDDATGLSQEAAVVATTIPPNNDNESAVLSSFAPGAYTAIVAGKAGGTGIGLVEVYNLK